MVAKSIAKMYTNIHKPTDYQQIKLILLGVNLSFMRNMFRVSNLNYHL